eukprot:GILI01010329.1.p1 GENE.GILI01010329.1~~GILI01010329.1.p1  ORF type:complete len:341 (+),score=41.67 GILI01010329.1:316-1338(+)
MECGGCQRLQRQLLCTSCIKQCVHNCRSKSAPLSADTLELQGVIERRLSRLRVLQQGKVERARRQQRIKGLRERVKEAEASVNKERSKVLELQSLVEANKTRLQLLNDRSIALKTEALQSRQVASAASGELNSVVSKSSQDLVQHRKRMVTETIREFSLKRLGRGGSYPHFSIGSVVVPNCGNLSEYLSTQSQDHREAATVAGHVCHLLSRISHYLQAPLPFPLSVCGSTSCVSVWDSDHRRRTLRLWCEPDSSQGPKLSEFSEGVKYLNLNILYMCWLQGVTVRFLDHTLSNLSKLSSSAFLGSILPPRPNPSPSDPRPSRVSVEEADDWNLIDQTDLA